MRFKNLVESAAAAGKIIEESFRDLEAIFHDATDPATGKISAAHSKVVDFDLKTLEDVYGYKSPVEALEHIRKSIDLSPKQEKEYSAAHWIAHIDNKGSYGAVDFINFVKHSLSELDATRQAARKAREFRRLYHKGTVSVYQPESPEAARALADGTKWKNTTRVANQFAGYKGKGDIYYIFFRKNQFPDNKISVFVNRDDRRYMEAFDAADHPIGMNDVAKKLSNAGIDYHELFKAIDAPYIKSSFR